MTKIQGRKKNKFCMLEDEKVCDNCLECNTCDLDPGKICDNCAQCIDSDIDYKVIEIDDIIIEKDLKRKLAIVDKKKTEKNKNHGQNET